MTEPLIFATGLFALMLIGTAIYMIYEGAVSFSDWLDSLHRTWAYRRKMQRLIMERQEQRLLRASGRK